MKYGLIEDSLLEYAARSGKLQGAIEGALSRIYHGDTDRAVALLKEALEEVRK